MDGIHFKALTLATLCKEEIILKHSVVLELLRQDMIAFKYKRITILLNISFLIGKFSLLFVLRMLPSKFILLHLPAWQLKEEKEQIPLAPAYDLESTKNYPVCIHPYIGRVSFMNCFQF